MMRNRHIHDLSRQLHRHRPEQRPRRAITNNCLRQSSTHDAEAGRLNVIALSIEPLKNKSEKFAAGIPQP